MPDNVGVWELLSLADMLQLDDLKNAAYLHIRGKICHFFHKVKQASMKEICLNFWEVSLNLRLFDVASFFSLALVA